MKKKSKPLSCDDLCFEEKIEENGICEFPVTGTPVAQFSFVDKVLPSNEPMLKNLQPEVVKTLPVSSEPNPPLKFTKEKVIELKDNRTLRSYPNGITPPVDGEYFDTKRSFSYRRSTVRMLFELKAAHPDINIYLNSIADKALRHYYEYIFKEKGSQI